MPKFFLFVLVAALVLLPLLVTVRPAAAAGDCCSPQLTASCYVCAAPSAAPALSDPAQPANDQTGWYTRAGLLASAATGKWINITSYGQYSVRDPQDLSRFLDGPEVSAAEHMLISAVAATGQLPKMR